MAEDNPYAVLGVPPNASADQIHDAYRRLAKRWHPDLNPSDPTAETHFKEIAGAYELLSHPDRRAAFDRGHAATEDEGNEAPRDTADESAFAPPDGGPDLASYVEELQQIRRGDEQEIRPDSVLVVLVVFTILDFVWLRYGGATLGSLLLFCCLACGWMALLADSLAD